MHRESDIIAGLKKGNNEAVEALINCYGSRMHRISFGITGDLQLAEEVVQDSLLQVCRKIHTFKEESLLQTWIFRITVNMAKNRLRSGWIRRISATGDAALNELSDPSVKSKLSRGRSLLKEEIENKARDLKWIALTK